MTFLSVRDYDFSIGEKHCMDARGLEETELLDGARRSSMEELARATVVADKVVVY